MLRNIACRFVLLVVVCLEPLQGLAETPAGPSAGAWTWIVLQGNVSPKLRASFELQPRYQYANPVGHFGTLLTVPSLGLGLIDGLYLWLGYTNVQNNPVAGRSENRVWEQLTYERNSEHLRAFARLRFEQRWIGGLDGVGLRMRLLLRAALPLGPDSLWRLVPSNELMFNVASVPAGPQLGFDQNRAQLTIQRQLLPWVTVDLGYMFHYLQLVGRPDLASHHAVVFVNFRFPQVLEQP